MNSITDKINKKCIALFITMVFTLIMVLSACGNTTDISTDNGDGVGQASADGGSGSDSDDSGEDSDPNAWLFSKPRPEYDWRQNVYSEYALDFKLEDNEPYHIFDINTVDGKILAVAKLTVGSLEGTIDGQAAIDNSYLISNYALALIDNAEPDEVTLLELPDEILEYNNTSGTGALIDSGYSNVKICYDGTIIGVYSGTVYGVDEAGEAKMSGVRYLTHWGTDGDIIWNTDISEYLANEYGFVKYANLLSSGKVAVFTECGGIYGFIIDEAGTIINGREIDEEDGLYFLSDIENDSAGNDVVFYSRYYSETVSLSNDGQDVEDLVESTDVADGMGDGSDLDEDPQYNRSEQLYVDAAYFDEENICLTDSVVIPYEIRKNDYYTISKGIDKDFIYSNSTGVYSFNIGDEEASPVMNYANSDFRGYYFTDLVAISEGEFVGIFTTYDEGIMIASGFAAVDPATLENTETIKLGVYGTDNTLRRVVREYNTDNQAYRIIIEDYSKLEVSDLTLEDAESYIVAEKQKAIAEGYTGSVTVTEADYYTYIQMLQLAQLRQDLLDRTGPDLLMINPDIIDYVDLASLGLLVDFDEQAALDVELSGASGDKLYDAYLMNAMDAFAIGGKHYLYLYDFNYNIYTGNSNSLILPSAKNAWSIIDFDIAYNQYHVGGNYLNAYDLATAPVLIAYKTRTQFIDILLKYDGAEFVDIENGTCDFDSEDFISLLKYAGSLDAQNDDSLEVYRDISLSYRNDGVLMVESVLGLGTPEGFWSDACRNFDGDYSCIGFPSRTGEESQSGVISIAELPIAIISNGNVEGAWNFAREFFCDGYQKSIVERGCGIPVLYDAFDEWFSQGMARSAGLYCVDENGAEVFCPNTYIVGGQYCTVPYMMDDDVQTIMNSIMICNKPEFTNSDIINIVKAESNLYFAGNITAEETAANIQKKVTDYFEQ